MSSAAHPASALAQYERGNTSSRAAGWAVVVVLHVLVAWALVSGTAKRTLEFIKKPLEAVVIQEVIIPPPPPPPPPPKEIKPVNVPKVASPPPPAPFVPPPETAAPPSTAPVIAATTTPPVAPPVIAPPAPPAAPAAPEPAKAPARAEIGVVCPTQVKPEMPRRASQDGAEGVVRAQATISNGVVKDVAILSGPRVFHAAVRTAMLQYKCSATSGDVLATQEFVFRVE